MKSSKILFLLAVGLSPAAFFVSGCSKSDDSTSNVDKAKTEAKEAVADVKAAASDSWDSIKDFTYDRRSDFSASIDRMSAKMDEKTRDFRAKVAAVPDSASKDRDSAVKEYDEARADLKAKLTDLGNATSDTWADAKAKVSDSWKRVQAAFVKVK
jgi:hypothetical protein